MEENKKIIDTTEDADVKYETDLGFSDSIHNEPANSRTIDLFEDYSTNFFDDNDGDSLHDELINSQTTDSFVDVKNIEGLEITKPEYGDNGISLLESGTTLSTSKREETTRKIYNKTPYKCNLCLRLCISKKHLERHIAVGHSTECMRCCAEFENLEMLAKHMKTHEADLTRFSCYVCKKGFDRKTRLIEHGILVSYDPP